MICDQNYCDASSQNCSDGWEVCLWWRDVRMHPGTLPVCDPICQML
uniref:Uncharacterized protein n=1 Tax=Anguilla anguilla TaxID=7936 RepID=A0A0E9R6I1_ANGAN